MMEDAAKVRQDLIEFFRRDLIGPMSGAAELIDERPSLRYSAGVLFPQAVERNESSEAGGRADDDSVAPGGGDTSPSEPIPPSGAAPRSLQLPHDEAEDDDTITLANSFKPAAMGISFACEVDTGTLVFEVRAATYARESTEEEVASKPDAQGEPTKKRVKRTYWRRTPLDLPDEHLPIPSALPHIETRNLAPGLALRVVIRSPRGERLRCTASLFNKTLEGSKEKEFFQVELSVRQKEGAAVFVEQRASTMRAGDDEEASLALLYRSRRTFAIGHGCAADWDEAGTDRAKRVATSVIPAVRVPPILPAESGARWLDMRFLSADETDDHDLLGALAELPSEYEDWMNQRAGEADQLVEPRLREAAQRHIGACRDAAARIRRGIAVLRDDAHALFAFKLMNQVMLRQQHHSRLRRELDDVWTPFPVEYSSERSAERTKGYWRKFQIAFILMALPGLLPEPDPQDRDLVDLIWFPTGGGKTEAYLGLAAFAIFRRRLADPNDAGCTVLMRYTLRLLTTQQFQRASSLICACELERRENPRRFGKIPISIGLWVGESLTPNGEDEACKLVNRLAREDESARNMFQLLSCPWCGTRLDDPKRLGYLVDKHRMQFRCPARGDRPGQDGKACPFSQAGAELPVHVVDETIYADPPTLLIGTVDKFAMLAWRAPARRLFGYDNHSSPDLVIQDELHLISGPLGSMVGLYEGAIDLLCRRGGSGPKIVASTATIRRAAEQCRSLFDREMAQFPPPGLDASDSYFAREESDATGRVYIGFLPTAASSPLTAQVRAVSALLQGLVIVTDDVTPDVALDPYWTLVQYFSSLKELGRAATLVAADIPEYLPSMYRRYALTPDRSRRIMRHEELTSRKREDEIPKILRQLELRYSRAARASRRDEQALDTLLATNMISVGVDVDRLGLMMVVTQPKGTAEYIQATSRVGRSAGAPGLVLALYNAGRPRDRSHYEQFRSYHEAFYRHVEPTSVTPFAVPALERALHAVMVIAARHLAGMSSPRSPDFSRPEYVAAIDFLRARVRSIDPDHAEAFEDLLARREKEWARWSPSDWGGFGAIETHALLIPAGKEPPVEYQGLTWSTPSSMRNVDVECVAAVAPYPED